MSIYSRHKELLDTRGRVLCEWERNGYHDSDFFALVWNPVKREPEQIEWGTTRGASIGYGDNCVVDATPAVRACYDAWTHRERAQQKLLAAQAAVQDTRTVGATVRVVRGRKVPRGTVGRVALCNRDKVAHVSRYGTWKTTYDELFIITENGAWYTNAENCELVTPSAEAIAAVPAAQDAVDAAENLFNKVTSQEEN